MFGAVNAFAAPKALIDAATVSGGAGSEEAYFAAQAGFAVTVVSDSTWASYTAADFGQYQLLIAGDPDCGSLPPGLVATAPIWGAVVLGHAGGRTQAGNRTIVGTDPMLHSGGNVASTRSIIIKDGIAYAGTQPGRTGMYLDTTCAANYYGQSAETLAVVNAISEGLGAWTLDANPPCGGNVSLIASNPSFSDLTTLDLAGWGCSVHESFPTFTSDWSALAVATDTVSHPTCGVDPNTGASACGEAYILISGSSIVVTSGSISVTPTDATNPTGTDHTVVAHVTSGGTPLAGQVVTFTVTGQNAGATGTCNPAGCITDANGDVSFTYHDTNGPGDDTIKASFVDAAGSLQSATAQKHWVGVVEEPITTTGVDVSATEGSPFTGTVATINDPTLTSTASEYSAMIDWGDGSPSTPGTIIGSGGSFTVYGSHTYAEEGSYTVTTTVTDVDNPDNGATATSTATVADAGLTSACAAPPVSGQSFAGTTANLGDANTLGSAADFTASINWGDSSSSTGTVSGSGGTYTVSGSHSYGSTGTYTVTTTVTDDGGSTTSTSCSVLVYAGAPGGGAFVIGDKSTTGTVTFWGAQWWKLNSLSGGAAPAAFKGYALNPSAPSCGVTWSTDPGNSAPPPAGPLPAFMAVIVSSSISKSGSQISGNTPHIVVVQTNAGYDANPGHAGTGTVVATIC
ncbi:MAG: Ig-like domain-containing protein [Gaiellaceae bacterium]